MGYGILKSIALAIGLTMAMIFAGYGIVTGLAYLSYISDKHEIQVRHEKVQPQVKYPKMEGYVDDRTGKYYKF